MPLEYKRSSRADTQLTRRTLKKANSLFETKRILQSFLLFFFVVVVFIFRKSFFETQVATPCLARLLRVERPLADANIKTEASLNLDER